MQSDSRRSSAYFLGVRLTVDEVRRLDEFQRTRQLRSRSDAIRALLGEVGGVGATSAELPSHLVTELDTIVEDGFAKDRDGALTTVVTLGLAELSRLHTKRVPALRRHAREAADRRDRRRELGREGRGLLER